MEVVMYTLYRYVPSRIFTVVFLLASAIALLTIALWIGASQPSAWAQSMTATPTLTTPRPTPMPTEPFEAFVQNDLQIVLGNVQRPNGIYWFDNFLWTGCAGDGTVYKIDDTSGETITYITGVQNTHSLYVETGPDIWLVDFQRNALIQITTSPRELNVIAENLAAPWGLVAAEDNTFYVTQFRAGDVINITREGEIEVVARGFRNPTGIALDGDYVYVANNQSARQAIAWFELPENRIPVEGDAIKPLVNGLQSTTNVILGPDKMLYFAYALGTRGIVGRVNPELCREKEGGCTNIDVEVVLWSELSAPLAGLTITPDMRMFIHTMFGAELYWVQLPIPPDLEIPETSADQ
jgi:hypothetical protein